MNPGAELLSLALEAVDAERAGRTAEAARLRKRIRELSGGVATRSGRLRAHFDAQPDPTIKRPPA